MRARVGTVIQARLGSTRLPGKVLEAIAGRPMLEHVVRRARAATAAPLVAVATTTRAADDAVADLAARLGAAVVRGPEDDVLERYRLAMAEHRLDVVVRVTSDCPLVDPGVLDRAVGALLDDPRLDYVSNTVRRTFPRGLDVEAIRAPALAAAAAEARAPHEREHVTPFIWQRPDRFRQRQILHSRDRSTWRLTVDVQEDLALVREVYGRLGGDGLFAFGEVEALLEREPGLLRLNAHVEQKAMPPR